MPQGKVFVHESTFKCLDLLRTSPTGGVANQNRSILYKKDDPPQIPEIKNQISERIGLDLDPSGSGRVRVDSGAPGFGSGPMDPDPAGADRAGSIRCKPDPGAPMGAPNPMDPGTYVLL